MTVAADYYDGVLKPPDDYPAFDAVYTRRLAYYPDDGRPCLIVIGFGPPEPDPRHPPAQRVLVSMKGGPFDGVFEAQGIDGLQCLVMSFLVVRGLLDPLGERIQFGMEPGETGIPGILPAWPFELNQRIEALARAEHERWHREDFRAWKAAHRDDFKKRRPWPED